MKIVRRILAIILGAIALAVAFHFICSPFYRDIVDTREVWSVLNWFMAFAVLVALAASYIRKQNMTASDARVNVVFYSTLLLAIWFFWNWFDSLAADSLGLGGQDGIHLILWAFIDPLLIILVGRLSVRLWKGDSR